MTSSTVAEEKRLLEVFDDGYKIFEAVSHCEEPTNSTCVQLKVKQAMRTLEDATRLTSLAGIFSPNETIDEVATENLRLFLLPALLGTLALKLTGSQNRIEVVQASDTYFRDFLERCNLYGVCNVEIPPPLEIECQEGKEDAVAPVRPMFDMAGAARTRAKKIARFKEEKALEEELGKLIKVIKTENVDEEVKRDYYLKLIKSYVAKAEEELDCLQSEKQILAHKAIYKTDNLALTEEMSRKKGKHPPPKPLQAVIITRDEVQKAVYGAGYPSLPTMTVQEFYDKRVKDGIFPDPDKAQPSLQKLAQQGTLNAELEEAEVIDRERRLERDDEEELHRLRQMDEFKDEHKRGEGNRYNRS